MNFVSLRSTGAPLVPYAKAWEYQKTLVTRRADDEIPDTILFVEHPPTVTRGRGLQWTPDRGGARAAPMGKLPEGTEYFEIERGGDLTWHGPGQLVIYPIVKLDGSGFGPNHDVTGFLRKLENAVSGWLTKQGLIAESRENATGIWVTTPTDVGSKKIASIGIAVRKWVTYHGLALNLTNSRDGFRAISPCGFDPEVMTTLADVLPTQEIKRETVEVELAAVFAGTSAKIDRVEI